MGSICGCNSIQNSEQYIKLLIETTCLQQIKSTNLDNILIYNMKRNAQNNDQLKFEINKDLFQLIVKDIIEPKCNNDHNNNNYSKTYTQIPIFVVKDFLEKLFDLINYNNNASFSLFKLIMCPITLKDQDTDEETKVKHLFNILKSINIKDNDSNISLNSIPFNQFCDSLLFYITSVISGYSKKLYETLIDLKLEPMIRCDLLGNLQEYCEMKLFNSYFNNIMNNFMKQLLLTEKEDKFDNYNVSYEDFKSIVNENTQLIHYFKLREDYLLFARKLKGNLNN